MSLSKRVWIEHDPTYEHVRDEYRAAAAKALEEREKRYTFRLACNRFEKVNGKRRLDRLWSIALSKAISETKADCIQINEGIFFQIQEDLDRVKKHAEKLRNDHTLLFGKQMKMT